MMKRLSIWLLVVGFVVFFDASEAFGCSCGPKPTVAEEMNYAKGVVVTGRIESIQKVREKEREYDYRAYRSLTLLVEKVYMGNVKPGDKLLLAQGNGSDCGFTWDEKSVGNRWLFYLGEPSTGRFGFPVEDADELGESEKVPMYSTGFCGRSTTVENAAVDLAYLNNLEKRKGKSRVSGELSFGERSVEGIEVRIKGKNSQFKTKYRKGDFFEIYDIPPGEYVLEVLPPTGWVTVEQGKGGGYAESFDEEAVKRLKKNQQLINVRAGGHVDHDLRLAPDTMIKGRLLSPTNKPMVNVTVSVERVGDSDKTGEWSDSTDPNGEFEFETLEPGNYLLIANPRGKVDDERPFGKLYYPGVAGKENAALIGVQPGNHVVGIVIQVPETTRLIEVTGRVLFADDKPKKDLWLRFEPTDKERFASISASTDEQGRFSFKVPLGAAGAIAGSGYFSEYSYGKCPEIMALVKASGASEVKTTTLEINGLEPITGVVLRLPFDFCEEK